MTKNVVREVLGRHAYLIRRQQDGMMKTTRTVILILVTILALNTNIASSFALTPIKRNAANHCPQILHNKHFINDWQFSSQVRSSTLILPPSCLIRSILQRHPLNAKHRNHNRLDGKKSFEQLSGDEDKVIMKISQQRRRRLQLLSRLNKSNAKIILMTVATILLSPGKIRGVANAASPPNIPPSPPTHAAAIEHQMPAYGRVQFTPEEFVKLRENDNKAPPLKENIWDDTSSEATDERTESSDIAMRKRRLTKFKKKRGKANLKSALFLIPAVGVWCTLGVGRGMKRTANEDAFVQSNIEKFEIQKAEFFNVTGEAESEDDILEGLRNLNKGNLTLPDEDDEEDEEEDGRKDDSGGDGEGVEEDRLPNPKPSNGGNSGRGGGDSMPSSPSSEGTDKGKPTGGSDYRPASDDDVERMKRMFKK